MDNKVICIIGLPGSGKTFLAERLLKSYGEDWQVWDDPGCKNVDAMLEQIKLGKNIIITDPHLCVLRNRDNAITLLQKTGVQITNIFFIFFENNPNMCIKNVSLRNDERDVINTIKLYTELYVPPLGCLSVWDWSGVEKNHK